jgi:cytochrome c553
MRKSRVIALTPYLFYALLFCGNSAVADADIEAGRAKSAACIACHGPNGNSTNRLYPVLAGRGATYIYFQLQDFKAGRRTDPNMSVIAASLTHDEIINLAVFYSSQIPVNNNSALDQQRIALGAQEVQEYSCTACHGTGLTGTNEFPKLAGQQPDYVSKQLMAFKNKTRIYDGGTMQNVTRTLSDEDILNIAHYIASLPPVVSNPEPSPSKPN